MKKSLVRIVLVLCVCSLRICAAEKPVLTLDEFFDFVSFDSLRLSPDGDALLIATERADWEHDRYRKDIWLYRGIASGSGGQLTALTRSGHDTKPEWSPDGRWVAFLSERDFPGQPKVEKSSACSTPENDNFAQLFVISASGGEAIPLTRGADDVHAFSWSADSRTLYFATEKPWTTEECARYKEAWKDVQRYRESERGDQIYSVQIAQGIAADSAATVVSSLLTSTPLRVKQLTTSPDGHWLALATDSVSQRIESMDDYEIYTVPLVGDARQPHRLTHNQAIEENLNWSPDSKRIFFTVEMGATEGPYRDLQRRAYSVDLDTGRVARWAADFGGAVGDISVAPSGSLFTTSRTGTQVQLYAQMDLRSPFGQQPSRPGTYNLVTTATHSPRVAFVYSSTLNPAEVYVADDPKLADKARSVTNFNALFLQRELPKGVPYRWKADDGVNIEGMLIYPPGKFGEKHLPMLTLIHGGPNDADGDQFFEADWYQWSAMAASAGWLVFEPNYRGSTGYGDAFLEGIVPQIVSRPGKDILEGVDALVRDGIAHPDHLTIGGYSYGGYMTNWLITQTTRFKAAVTGAGAVENTANWGNDDMTLDDAYFLGGRPWEAAANYQREAALFQISKVRTPTHIVAGSDDVRVPVLETYLLERALHSLGVPSTLLIFPDEGHSLTINPWHGKVKVREELKWLEKYGK